jgi:hypothetical protein
MTRSLFRAGSAGKALQKNHRAEGVGTADPQAHVLDRSDVA